MQHSGEEAGWQDRPSPHPCPAQATKKTQWVGWSVNTTEWCLSRNGSATQIFSWRWKRTFPRTPWSERRPGCARKAGGRALRLRSSGRRSMVSGSPTSRRGSRLQRRCGMARRRRTVVQATGASSCASGTCFTTVALILSGNTHTGRSHQGKLANSQHGRPVAHLPGTAVRHRWRLPGGAQAAGGWRMGARHRWLCGGAAARHGHAVASGSLISSLSP